MNDKHNNSNRNHSEHKHQGHDDSSHDHGSHKHHEMMFRRRFWVCLVLTIPVLIFSETIQQWFGFSPPSFPGSDWISPVISIAIFFYGGIVFVQMAWGELKKKQPGMMTLISMAILVAFVYSLATEFMKDATGFFWELVTLIDVMLLGHWIEMRSVRSASQSLDELAKLMPDKAERVKEDEQTEEVTVDNLEQGDVVLVRPGSNIPADGEVVKGESGVNESMITGESKPVTKTEGDEVIAGTTNGDGSLQVRVSATGDQTAVAGIMRLVKEAQESKSRSQLLADRAAGWLFYIALAVAAITAVVWTMFKGAEVDVIKRVATVLVIACPHALGLAIPLVVARATTLAAQAGVLIRDRLALEKAREIDSVVFDKTGTLTEGQWGVEQVIPADNRTEDEVLSLAAAVESDSEHMIAKGIRQAAQKKELSLPQVTDFEAMKGRGVRASHDGAEIYVGGPSLLKKLEIDLSGEIEEFTRKGEQQAQTIVYLVEDGKLRGAIALSDKIRPESKKVVRRLHEMNIEVVMMTGDSEAAAKGVAKQIGIDTYFAEVLPENKDKKIQQLQEQKKSVAMVGDGVNDAPALTRADVGIAIGGGTDVAIESAGIILVKNNPLDVLKVFRLSHANRRKMVQNLFWAAGYNVIALPLAAGVLAPIGVMLSPAVGALIMSLSTVIVAINARLLNMPTDELNEEKAQS